MVRERDDLAARVRRRAETLLEEPGLEEVREALCSPVADTAAGIIGLREITALLAGDIDRAQCLERIEAATRRYAKRQMTWFRREAFQDTVSLSAHADPEVLAQALAAKIAAP